MLVLQREVDVAQNRILAARARRSGSRTLLNAAPATGLAMAELDSIDVIVVNEHEAVDLAQAAGLDAAQGTAEALSAHLEKLIVVTLWRGGGDRLSWRASLEEPGARHRARRHDGGRRRLRGRLCRGLSTAVRLSRRHYGVRASPAASPA